MNLRQAFELVVLLRFFYSHPEIAAREIHAFPLHAINIFRKAGRTVEADYLEKIAIDRLDAHPELKDYKTRTFPQTAELLRADELMNLAALDLYKLPSQTSHGTVLSIVSTFDIGPDGVPFLNPDGDRGSENQILANAILLELRFIIDLAKALKRTAPNFKSAMKVLIDRVDSLNLQIAAPVSQFIH